MSLHLFVDTNVWLSFFAFSKDDIAQLGKLTDLIKNGNLTLYVTQQVADEFTRNREVKLAESIKEIGKSFSKAVPRFLADSDAGKAFKTVVDEYEKAKNELIQQATSGAENRTFAVDVLVNEVFAEAAIGSVTPETIERARLRRDIGNPPGKGTSLGDQINWEYLLETVPDDVTLHVVSKDGDYQSAMKNGRPHHYLCDEWRNRKNGDLQLHQELKPFLNAHFQAMQLQVDHEKNAAVHALVESVSFSATHSAIAQIYPFFDALTAEDANLLLEKGLENNQISWIAKDSDVKKFYGQLIDKFNGQFKDGLEAQGIAKFRPTPKEDNEESPDAG